MNLPITPKLERALTIAETQARKGGCNYIGTEHVLLALVMLHAGRACEVLEAANLSAKDIKRRLTR